MVEVSHLITFGGAEGIRTPDFLLAKEALSRAELQPHEFSDHDTAISKT